MIDAGQALELADGDLEINTLQKRTFFELQQIYSEIRARALCKGGFLVYTVYKNFLDNKDFKKLIINIRDDLRQNHYGLARVNVPETDSSYTFKILWRNNSTV
jgi:hypothetical protein